ncbi:MAG TPA: signal peptidase II [Candidatus Dormibacteraeota bacterium]|jgi:signal peptidase II
MSRRGLAGATLVAILVVAADQASKAWATARLTPEQRVTVLPGWLWFRLLKNSGATFSVLRGHNLLFAVATLLVVVAIMVILLRGYVSDLLSIIALGAVGGGAVGNLLDRIRIAGVTDFIQIRVWPTDFNLADVAIRLGVLSLLVGVGLEQLRRRRESRSA